MIDNNDILDLLWQNWIDDVNECLNGYLEKYGRYLYEDSFEMVVDEVWLEDIENITVESYNIENNGFGVKTVLGNAGIICLLEGVCYCDREYHHIGEITKRIPLTFNFIITKNKEQEFFDRFSCECVVDK